MEAAPEERLVIVAGPGAGKTAVIVERVRALIEDGGLDRPGDILVVSFSRAAVGVVADRLAGVEDADSVEVRTLDSIAAEILDEEGVDGWESMSFDARIRRALSELRDGSEPRILDVAHLIVDEVQDIVGERADLVIEALRKLDDDAGFTLLGDPMQAIYDFQLGPKGGTGWKGLMAAATNDLGGRQTQLNGDYRSKDDQIRNAVQARRKLSSVDAVPRQALALAHVLNEFPSAGSVEAFARYVPRWAGSTAVLTWTNGEALSVWDQLWQAGVPARLQRRAEEVVLVPWIASVMSQVQGHFVDRERFLSLAAATEEVPDDAWEKLRRASPGYNDEIDVAALARNLRRGDPPPGLEARGDGVVVSTIHRAKGLEFDNVVLVGPAQQLSPARKPTEQTVREAYVAMTRGMARLVVAEWTRDLRLRKEPRTDRWYVPGYEKWMTRGFEVRGGDTAVPAGDDVEWANSQEYLRTAVSPGDVVELALDPRRSFEVPTYRVLHEGTPVGRTNPDFGAALSARVRMRQASGRAWPELVGARVEALETRTGAGGGAERPYFWLNPRVAGLANLEW
ncbi:UvrD-helicase domain-containing protein [Georgenia sp. SUBG003]|uniref:UvrD-helicase domain-containing protein n=1 Tax=Georgenia sp. SUBG003 TaxID=1497974 RepID=UPI003AB2DFB1